MTATAVSATRAGSTVGEIVPAGGVREEEGVVIVIGSWPG
jgi:hypothetical protein